MSEKPQPTDSHRSSKLELHRRIALPENLKRIGVLLSHFVLGQGAVLLIGFLAELFLVRFMSVEQYAEFGVAYGFQVSLRALMDLGFASTIIPLVGERHDDNLLIGRYVSAAKRLRDKAFFIGAPFAAIAFLAVVHKHHWPVATQVALLGSVLLSLFSSGGLSYYGAPLLLKRKLRDFYFPQTLFGTLRLLAYVAMRQVGILSSAVAALFSALNITASSLMLRKKARENMTGPATNERSTEREIIHYILPAMPAVIFSAFQAQISLFLISIFGQMASIAQVAALGRIGQLFAVLMTFNAVIVEPYVARLSREKLLPTYLRFVITGTVAGALFSGLAFFFPSLFLWILGAKYASLRSVIGWFVLAGCINYVAGLMWIMNRARKWLFWSGTWLEIFLVLAVQIIYLILVGVHTTQSAVLFTFTSSFCYLVAHAYVAVLGFFKGSRELRKCSAPH